MIKSKIDIVINSCYDLEKANSYYEYNQICTYILEEDLYKSMYNLKHRALAHTNQQSIEGPNKLSICC